MSLTWFTKVDRMTQSSVWISTVIHFGLTKLGSTMIFNVFSIYKWQVNSLKCWCVQMNWVSTHKNTIGFICMLSAWQKGKGECKNRRISAMSVACACGNAFFFIHNANVALSIFWDLLVSINLKEPRCYKTAWNSAKVRIPSLPFNRLKHCQFNKHFPKVKQICNKLFQTNAFISKKESFKRQRKDQILLNIVEWTKKFEWKIERKLSWPSIAA